MAHGKTMWAAWSTCLGGWACARGSWAFDSFEGLPDPGSTTDRGHPSWQMGRYAVGQDRFRANLQSMGVPEDDVTVVAGFFSDSLAVQRRPKLPSRVALAYVDCDMYSSTVDVLDYLKEILATGSIVAFDDWFCWSPVGRSGEELALRELFRACPELEFNPYVPIGSRHGMWFFVTRS